MTTESPKSEKAETNQKKYQISEANQWINKKELMFTENNMSCKTTESYNKYRSSAFLF